MAERWSHDSSPRPPTVGMQLSSGRWLSSPRGPVGSAGMEGQHSAMPFPPVSARRPRDVQEPVPGTDFPRRCAIVSPTNRGSVGAPCTACGGQEETTSWCRHAHGCSIIARPLLSVNTACVPFDRAQGRLRQAQDAAQHALRRVWPRPCAPTHGQESPRRGSPPRWRPRTAPSSLRRAASQTFWRIPSSHPPRGVHSPQRREDHGHLRPSNRRGAAPGPPAS